MTTEHDQVAASREVYDFSTSQFVEAVGTELSADFEAPLDLAVLEVFIAMVAAVEPGIVLDVGCGPGRVAALMSERGLDVQGTDISPRMIEHAQAAHPTVHFEVAPLTELPAADRSVSGAAYWYSIITTPLKHLGPVWVELDRVLHADGVALIAFQCGNNDHEVRTNAYGSSISLTLVRHSIEDVTNSLEAAGFAVRVTIQREPEFAHETAPQAFLLVHRV